VPMVTKQNSPAAFASIEKHLPSCSSSHKKSSNGNAAWRCVRKAQHKDQADLQGKRRFGAGGRSRRADRQVGRQ
jgi:hypothetical protein